MDLSEMYEGNLEELRHIRQEIQHHHRLQADIAQEYAILQEHQEFVLKLLRQKARGGKDPKGGK